MDENHSNNVNSLMDNLLLRLNHEVKNGPPQSLPMVTDCVMGLYQLKNGINANADMQRAQINLLKKVTNEFNGPGTPPSQK